ncbi:37S ribosomal protein Mrp10, mitochondrial [Aspergillus crustosus]
MPKPTVTGVKPIRLNSITYLRVKRPNQNQSNACATVMSSMLNCWAATGQGSEMCAILETQLKECMDTQQNKNKGENTVNYHLMRMYPKVVGPKKKKGVIG